MADIGHLKSPEFIQLLPHIRPLLLKDTTRFTVRQFHGFLYPPIFPAAKLYKTCWGYIKRRVRVCGTVYKTLMQVGTYHMYAWWMHILANIKTQKISHCSLVTPYKNFMQTLQRHINSRNIFAEQAFREHGLFIPWADGTLTSKSGTTSLTTRWGELARRGKPSRFTAWYTPLAFRATAWCLAVGLLWLTMVKDINSANDYAAEWKRFSVFWASAHLCRSKPICCKDKREDRNPVHRIFLPYGSLKVQVL